MSQRTCAVDGCARKHRARGFCSSHYNQRHQSAASRWPTEVRACVVCGANVVRRVDNQHTPTCSVECRTFHQFGRPGAAYDWTADAMRRARSFGAPVVTAVSREDVFDRDDYKCQSCGMICTEPNPFVPTSATVDHATPLSEGGEHTMANVRTLCLSCNSAKQARAA